VFGVKLGFDLAADRPPPKAEKAEQLSRGTVEKQRKLLIKVEG
jgi:hypothetical protein